MVSSRSTSHRTAAVLITLSALFLALDAWYPPLFVGAREATLTISHPVRRRAERVSARAGQAWVGLVDYPEVAAENERLRAQLAVLEAAPGHQGDVELELRRLLTATQLDHVADRPTVTASVISNRLTAGGHLLEINKGSDSGVAEGMSVMTARGLVGMATLVSPDRSVITPITEPGSVVGVRSDGGIGVVTGRGPSQSPALALEPHAEHLNGGSRLVTSGVNRSLFPASIPVGEVSGANNGRIEPFVDFDDLSYVSVVLWRPER